MHAVDHFFKINNTGTDGRNFADSSRNYRKAFWRTVMLDAVDTFVSQYSLGYIYWEFDNAGKFNTHQGRTHMQSKFNYRTTKNRIDKLKALALLLGIDANEVLDAWVDNKIDNVYRLLTEGVYMASEINSVEE